MHWGRRQGCLRSEPGCCVRKPQGPGGGEGSPCGLGPRMHLSQSRALGWGEALSTCRRPFPKAQEPRACLHTLRVLVPACLPADPSTSPPHRPGLSSWRTGGSSTSFYPSPPQGEPPPSSAPPGEGWGAGAGPGLAYVLSHRGPTVAV